MAQRSALRNFLTHGFHLLVMLVVGSQIRDTQCGFKVRRTFAAGAGGAGGAEGGTLVCVREGCEGVWGAFEPSLGSGPAPCGRLRHPPVAAPCSLLPPFHSHSHPPATCTCTCCTPAAQLFTRGAAQQLYSNQRLQRWCFDVELVHLAQQLKVQCGAGWWWCRGWGCGAGGGGGGVAGGAQNVCVCSSQ